MLIFGILAVKEIPKAVKQRELQPAMLLRYAPDDFSQSTVLARGSDDEKQYFETSLVGMEVEDMAAVFAAQAAKWNLLGAYDSSS